MEYTKRQQPEYISTKRTLTPNLREAIQETNLLTYRNQPKNSQEAWLLSPGLQWQYRKLSNNSCNNWPQMASIWSIIDSFLMCVPSSNQEPTRDSQICTPDHMYTEHTTLVSLLTATQASNQDTAEAFPLFYYKAFLSPCLPLSFCQNASDSG